MRFDRPAVLPAAAILLAGLLAAAAAAAGSGSEAPPDAPLGPEPYDTGWSLYVDNDALTLINRDQQYTGGFALTLSGRRAVEYPWSLDPVLGWLDRATGFASLSRRGPRSVRHSFEVGVTVFTPADVEASAPIRDDHPYAGLVFVSNTRQSVLLDERISYQSTFALGVLGTDIPRGIQNVFHEALDSQKPQGWDNQVSDGGEPTFNYVVSRQQPHWIDDDHRGLDFDIRSIIGASIGYTTQVGAGINWRLGRIRTPWWGFNPDYSEYINLGTPVASKSASRGDSRELFLWGGLQVRQRFYNALLEGQFRDSEVTFDRGELESTLLEGSIGITWGSAGGTRITAALRGRTPELEDADGLDPFWGSVIISRAF